MLEKLFLETLNRCGHESHGLLQATQLKLNGLDDFALSALSLTCIGFLGLIFARLLRVSPAGPNDDSAHEVPHELLWKEIPPENAKGTVDEMSHAGLKAGRLSAPTMRSRSAQFLRLMSTRRSLRFFSQDPIPDQVLERCIQAAATSPSGAHKQPWVFAVVKDSIAKHKIRELVEAEEEINYSRRMRKSWVHDVSHLLNKLHGDDGPPLKEYLTDAPALVVVFKVLHDVGEDGDRQDNYYVPESVGIAVGMLIAALHNVGIATLTSTPMGAEAGIRKICGRKPNEKAQKSRNIGSKTATRAHCSTCFTQVLEERCGCPYVFRGVAPQLWYTGKRAVKWRRDFWK